MGTKPVEYTKSVNNAGTTFIAIKPFMYTFKNSKRMVAGDKVTPSDCLELEYCQQLAFNGVLTEVSGE